MKNFLATTTAALLMLAAIPARAQDSQPPQDSQDPTAQQDQQDSQYLQDQSPAYPQDSGVAPDQRVAYPQKGTPQQTPQAQPGVARVSMSHGDVAVQHGDKGEWTSVTLNTPISQDDRVSTGEKSRAELQLDWANILRMSDRATARIASISRTRIQLQIGQGLTSYNVLKGSEASTEIDTPNAAIRPREGEGQYRILVNSDAETQVIVRKGAADIVTSTGSTHVEKGDMITVAGTDTPQYKVARAIDEDSWDDWNNDRNKIVRRAESWRKTNQYYVGSEDLDRYGTWTEIPDYGPVWTPSQGPGWAPYRAGRWVWNPYYGWTWDSYEPWGWAPYHYGRWFVYGGSWVWWPGPLIAYPAYYPVWAPAYVSFFGWGGGGWGFGVGFGFGFGHVGWLPCGPGDWFHPWWGRGVNRVNVVNVTNIHNRTFINNGMRPLAPAHFRQFSNINSATTNERIRSGISSMDGNRFGREAVPSHQQRIDGATFQRANMMTGRMPVTPSRESFRSTDKAPGASAVRNAPSNSQRFFSPTARTSVSMAANTHNGMAGLNSNARTNTQGAVSTINGGGPRGFGSTRQPTSTAAQAQSAQPPARNNSSTARPSNPQAAQQSQQGSRNGWQHFTPPPSRGSQPAGPQPSARQYQSPYGNSRGGYPNASNRPPLNMNKPIVQPRGGYPNAPRGGYSTAPRGGYPSAPRPGNSGGGYRGPSGAPGSSAPHGNSSGGSHGGGGSSHGSSGHSH